MLVLLFLGMIGLYAQDAKVHYKYNIEKDGFEAHYFYASDYSLGSKHWCSIEVDDNDTKSLAFLRQVADAGNVCAMTRLGWRYRSGHGVAQDFQTAMRWYRLAARRGDAAAQTGMGELYGEGLGVARDHVETLSWYRHAGNQGNADAQFQLGRYYENGWGLDPDLSEAIRWYEKAARQGNEDAKAAAARLESRVNHH